MNNKPLVSVCCITYNHAPYIQQCIKGFLIQKTNFSFEIIINDDCSTDGTTEILKQYADKYPNLIRLVLHDENQYSKGIRSILATFVYPLAKGKYIALCEGDDYWTDPLKLQKQADFLEKHSDYGMVYTGHRRFIQEENRFVEGHNVCQDFNDLLFSNKIATHTVMLCLSLWKDYNKEIAPIAKLRHWKMGDTPLWLYIMAHSKAKYMPDITGVYRKLENSASHFTSYKKDRDFWVSHYDMSLFFAKKYNVPVRIQKKIALDEVEYLLGMAQSYDANLIFPFYKHLKENGVFTWQRYISCKMRSSRIGRKFYSALKS